MEQAERILFQNDCCAVLNKKSGEHCESDGAAVGNAVSLCDEARALFPAVALVEAAHRLDVPVTGCVLVALSKDALGFLQEQFRAAKVTKTYIAVIEKPAAPLGASGTLRHWVSVDKKKNKARALDKKIPNLNAKYAELRYQVAGAGDNYLFMNIDLVTGRQHQIRAQLAAIGLHIKGDLKYGAARSEKLGGIRLHARSISFPNPVIGSNETITVTAPLPFVDPLWSAFPLSDLTFRITTNLTNDTNGFNKQI
jgi:23S rRNA pseudouridine1911/1915/1917 synthase